MSNDSGSESTPFDSQPWTGNDTPKEAMPSRRILKPLQFEGEEGKKDREQVLYVRGKLDKVVETAKMKMPLAPGDFTMEEIGSGPRSFMSREIRPDLERVEVMIDSNRFAIETKSKVIHFITRKNGVYLLSIPLVTDEHWKERVDKEVAKAADRNEKDPDIHGETRYLLHSDGLLEKQTWVQIRGANLASNVPVPAYGSDIELMLAAAAEVQDGVNGTIKKNDEPYTGKDEPTDTPK